MKKKRIVIICIVIAFFLVLIGIGAFTLRYHELTVDKGIYFYSESGHSHLIVIGKEPIVMKNCSRNKKLFEKLQDGDQVIILHNGINETYPASTGIYVCRRLSKGHMNEVGDDVQTRLKDLGWIK